MEELKDGLQLACIQKADLRQQAKGLRKVHLQDCLIEAQAKRQHKRVSEIKQKINRKESKRMWYLIKRTVKNPHSPSVSMYVDTLSTLGPHSSPLLLFSSSLLTMCS